MEDQSASQEYDDSPGEARRSNVRIKRSSEFPELYGSFWSLCEQSERFDLGLILSATVTDFIQPQKVGDLELHHAGLWECDLSDNSLVWSGGVYDIFGLPRGIEVPRNDILALYSERSRVTMERLRAHAITHHCGFTLDVEIDPISGGDRRRMRIIGSPVVEDDSVTRLHGLKLFI